MDDEERIKSKVIMRSVEGSIYSRPSFVRQVFNFRIFRRQYKPKSYIKIPGGDL